MARIPFVLIDLPANGKDIEIIGDEAHHLRDVLRFRSGNPFIAFDGKGRSWHAEVKDVSAGAVSARLLSELPTEKILPPRICICVGIIKGGHMDWAVEKAAETGASDFIPLKTARSVVAPGEGRLNRWRSIALAAAKQSRRALLMNIKPPVTLNELLNSLPDKSAVAVLHPNENSLPVALVWRALTEWNELMLIIGPEGGFTDSEIELMNESGIPCMSLGRHFYRTDTAVAVSVGMFNALKEAQYGG